MVGMLIMELRIEYEDPIEAPWKLSYLNRLVIYIDYGKYDTPNSDDQGPIPNAKY